jgi:hypothetical protein
MNPVNGNMFAAFTAHNKDDGVKFFSTLKAYQSVFFLFQNKFEGAYLKKREPIMYNDSIMLSKDWAVSFDEKYGGPSYITGFRELKSWTDIPDTAIKYYSGEAVYENNFYLSDYDSLNIATLVFENIFNVAGIKINGVDCGTLWTKPFVLDITKALKQGQNHIEVTISNTWRNRLVGDELNPEKRKTWLNSPYPLKNKPLLPAGIVGDVKIFVR